MNRTALLIYVLGVTSCMLCSCAQSKRTVQVGEHSLEIIESRGGTWGHSELYSLPDGTRAYTYESDTVKVKLEHEVLTVNGKTYIIPRKDDSVRIIDGRVEINGQLAKPEGGS
jgi:hypothetical protein